MYAPLALKSVYNKRLFFRGSDLLLLFPSVPVNLTISNPSTTPTPPSTTPTPSKSHTVKHTGMIAGGVIGGVTALLAIGTVALAVWHRRRQRHRRISPSVGSSSLRDATDQGTQVTVTPFGQTGLALTEAEDPSLPLRRGTSFPVGLSGKELARLRSNGLRSQPMDGRPSSPPLTATNGSDAFEGAAATASSEAQSLRFESNFLRHDIPVERSESPPSYVSRPWASDIPGLS